MKNTILQNIISNFQTMENDHFISWFNENQKWMLEEEKKQLICFGYSQINYIDSEIGDLIYKKVPEEIYKESFLAVL